MLLRSFRYVCEKCQDVNRLFVSYSWEDETAHRYVHDTLVPLLQEHNVDYFLDLKDILQERETGYLPWQLQQGIGLSDTILVVCTERACGSLWMNLELVAAIAMLKDVTVLRIGGSQLDPLVESQFANATYLEAADYDDRRIHVEVLNSLKTRRTDFVAVSRQNEACRTSESVIAGVSFEWIRLNGGVLSEFEVLKYLLHKLNGMR